jgi:anti-sigma B factor antagonist
LSVANREQPRLCSTSIERCADRAVIRLEGEFDLSYAGELEARVAHVRTWDPSTVVVDLRDLAFIDSVGLGILVALARVAHEDDFELILVHAAGQVRKVFAITGLDRSLALR